VRQDEPKAGQAAPFGAHPYGQMTTNTIIFILISAKPQNQKNPKKPKDVQF